MFFIKIQFDKRFIKINDNFIREIVMQYLKLFFLIILFIPFKIDAQSLKNEFVVVLDAGHGGKDPGNRGNGYYEKNISLKIALNIGEILSKNSVRVVYTRKKDVFPIEPLNNEEEFISKLRGLKNLILSPHIGGSTKEAQKNIGSFVPDKIIDFINTGNTSNCVNFPELSLPEQKDSHRLIHIHYKRSC